MDADKDLSIAQLLEESKAMIHRLEELTGGGESAEISAEAQKLTLEDLGAALEPAADASFSLFVEDDALTAVAEFHPPANGGRPLDLETVEKALAARGVVHGVLWPVVHTALRECNLDLALVTDVVVARATPPVPSVREHLELLATWQPAPPVVRDGVRVDFKEISPFVMIRKGDLIARRVAESFGSRGTDVLGNEIPSPLVLPPVWSAGENVAETPVGLEAATDGRLVMAGQRIDVSAVLELEAVDYRTGNIRFRGDVLLKGPVSPGFELEIDRSLTSTETLDAFQIKAGGDVATTGGILGNGLGRVEVGGKVSAKFLEHLYLLAEGDVFAEASVLNSVVKTKGKLVLGEKGILAGGQVHALHGVETHQISTPTGPRTEIFLGLDFQGMERLLWIRERSRELHSQLKKVDAALPYGGSRVPDLLAAAKKLRVEIAQLAEAARAQLEKLGQDEEASLTVKGAVYPGTSIEICHVQFHVNQTMSGVRFFLDKRKGIIGVDTTTPSATHQKKR